MCQTTSDLGLIGLAEKLLKECSQLTFVFIHFLCSQSFVNNEEKKVGHYFKKVMFE